MGEGNDRNVLFHDALNMFLWLYGISHTVKDQSYTVANSWVTLSNWQQGILKNRPLHRQGNTHHNLCYDSCGALDGRKEGNILFNDALFYMHHSTDRIAHTMAFVTPVMEHWLEQEIAQWVHPMKDRSNDPSHHERTLLPQSYILLCTRWNEK